MNFTKINPNINFVKIFFLTYLSGFLVICLVTINYPSIPNIELQAVSSSEIAAQKKVQTDKLAQIQGYFNDANNQKNTVSEQKTELEKQITETEKFITDNQKLVLELQKQKTETQDQIKILIAKQRELIQVKQEKSAKYTDPTSIIAESAFTSSNLGDFFSKMYLISNLENEINNVSNDLTKKNEELEQTIEETEDGTELLEQTKIAQTQKEEELKILIEVYTGKEAQYATDLANKKSEIQKLDTQITQRRQEEQAAAAEAKRKADAEAQAARQRATQNTNTNVQTDNNTNIANNPGGSFGFIFPTTWSGTYTSRCVQYAHVACDFWNFSSPSINAALGGVVTTGYEAYGYGNYIKIDHGTINGQKIVTLYAHMSKLYVGSGSWVSQGQAIGQMGCVGACTGTHLHFEVRVDGIQRDPRNYLASIPEWR